MQVDLAERTTVEQVNNTILKLPKKDKDLVIGLIKRGLLSEMEKDEELKVELEKAKQEEEDVILNDSDQLKQVLGEGCQNSRKKDERSAAALGKRGKKEKKGTPTNLL